MYSCERDRHVMSVEVVGLGVVTNWDVVYSSLASYEIFIINEQSQVLHYGQTVQTRLQMFIFGTKSVFLYTRDQCLFCMLLFLR